MSTSALLELRGITKVFRDTAVPFYALQGVQLTVEQGELVALTGPSGCGKTTLLNIIGCIETPDEGEVHFDGQRVPYGRMSELDAFRRDKVGLIFQDFNLIDMLTAYENVELPIFYGPLSAAERRQRVAELLIAVGLERHTQHRPAALSGGQCQRVAVARAMVNRPRLVLADEPTANLDAHSAREVIDLMTSMAREHGTTFLVATHDPRIIDRMQRRLSMMEGRIEC